MVAALVDEGSGMEAAFALETMVTTERQNAGGRAAAKIVGMLAMALLLTLTLPARGASAAGSGPIANGAQLGPHFDDRPLQLELIFGFGTTVGVLGLVLDYNVGDWLALGAGAGLGIHGPLWEAHARFRPLVGRLGGQSKGLQALTLETAFSQGPYADLPKNGFVLCDRADGAANRVGDDCFQPNAVPRLTSFGQLELGWEARFESGFSLRLSGGFATALHMGTPRCYGASMQPVPCGGSEPERTIVVLTSAFGYAF